MFSCAKTQEKLFRLIKAAACSLRMRQFIRLSVPHQAIRIPRKTLCSDGLILAVQFRHLLDRIYDESVWL
ncbi:hypothetical protein CG51_18360 [Haematobacter missouriensis]|nr:hypothetical protein CG51_18360 [Haematobacter missouriensis]